MARVAFQAIEAFVPELAIAFEPVVDVLRACGSDPAGPPLRLRRAR